MTEPGCIEDIISAVKTLTDSLSLPHILVGLMDIVKGWERNLRRTGENVKLANKYAAVHSRLREAYDILLTD
jgi:hypothetical protein